ncbi:MAG: hypothetical protein EHM87_20120 [Burkholderiales bacterium]|nr:MAG: hypothetical protein EHM87_20120 [Burkholderiales bacterium]
MFTDQISLTTVVCDFCINRLFANFSIESGDLAKANPAVLDGTDFVMYFNYLEKEAKELKDPANFKGHPLFDYLYDFVYATMYHRLSNVTVTRLGEDETEDIPDDVVSCRIFPVSKMEVVQLDIPDNIIEQTAVGLTQAILESIRQDKIILKDLYQDYCLISDKLLLTMDDRCKLDSVSAVISLKWSNGTVSAFTLEAPRASRATTKDLVSGLTENIAMTLIEETVHMAVDCAVVKTEQKLDNIAIPCISKDEVADLIYFLEHHSASHPVKPKLTKILKRVLLYLVKD